MSEMKVFILIFIVLFCFGCEMEEVNSSSFDYIEHYILINPGNLFNNSKGDLSLNYSQNSYSMLYDFSCIYKKDTVNFYLSESGTFSDTYMKVKNETSPDDQGYYYSGKISFSPEQDSSWGCSYQISDSIGFMSLFFSPPPHLITNIPVYDHKMILHTTDPDSVGVIKPWIEIVPIEYGRCDTIQLFWL
jgi:hypothetical protein